MGLVDFKSINNWLTVNPKVGGEVNPTKRVVQQSPQVQGLAAINHEVTPRYLDTATAGKTFTNGIGESKFGAFKPYLA